MTVRELITALQEMPPDARVEAEGCDCIGECDGVELQVSGRVLLLRPDLDAPYWRRASAPKPDAATLARWAAEAQAERTWPDGEPTAAECAAVAAALRR